jgi:hypothetical protein
MSDSIKGGALLEDPYMQTLLQKVGNNRKHILQLILEFVFDDPNCAIIFYKLSISINHRLYP